MIPVGIPISGMKAVSVEPANLPRSQGKGRVGVVKVISDIWQVRSRVAAAMGKEEKTKKANWLIMR
jgi:hypothetical protein